MPIDLAEKIPEELIVKHPELRKALNKSVVHVVPIGGRIGGRRIAQKISIRGIILDSDGFVTFYAGYKSFFGWDWFDAIRFEIKMCEWVYTQRDKPHLFYLDVKFPVSEDQPKSIAKCTVNLLSEFATNFPEIPATLKFADEEFESCLTKFEIRSLDANASSITEDNLRIFNGLLGLSKGGVKILQESGDSKIIRLPDANYLGTVSVNQTAQDAFLSQELEHAWWCLESKKLTLVKIAAPEDKLLVKGNHPHRELVARPIVVRITGILSESVFHSSPSICFSTQSHVEIYNSKGESFNITRRIESLQKDEILVLVSKDQNVCATVSGNPKAVAAHLGMKLKNRFKAENWFLVLLKATGQKGLTWSIEYPMLLEIETEPRSVIGPIPLRLEPSRLERVSSCRYILHTEDEKIELRVAESDDVSFRKASIHNVVKRQLNDSGNQKMAFLYGTMNELRVRKFMRLLYTDVVRLYQEMQSDQSPKELLYSFDTNEDPSKKNKEALISKLVLLAQTLPQLKRNLEQLGTFYPHQVNRWDTVWLESTFGIDVASKWSGQQGQRQTEKLRGFVRNTQSSLWRSLSEIERGLAKLEPVYSETLRKTRKSSNLAQAGVSSTGLAIGGAAMIVGGGWVLAGMAALNMSNSIYSLVSRDRQLQALLIDHGPDVLRWWQVFSQVFHVQVHESKTYLVQHFDGLSKRDAEIFKQLLSSAPELQDKVKVQLRQQILLESEERFQPLWKGEKQIAQDLIELLEGIEGAGASAVLNANDYARIQKP